MKKTITLALVLGAVLVLATLGTAKDPAPKTVSRAIVKIDGLTCGGCFSTINAGLAGMEGYAGMGANLFRKMVAVDFNAPLTPQAICEKLADLGYPGTLDSVSQVSEKESFAYLRARRAAATGSCCSLGRDTGPKTSAASCCTLPRQETTPPPKSPTRDL